MFAAITLGKFSAALRHDGEIEVTIYDRDDTSIVESYTLAGVIDPRVMDQTWLHLRDLNTAEVVTPDRVGNGPWIVGFTFEGDRHCLDCARSRFGHAAIVWAMDVTPDYHNTVLLLTSMYPKDREGNLIHNVTLAEAEHIQDTDEDQRVPRCGDCGIALCEPVPVMDVDLVGFEADDLD